LYYAQLKSVLAESRSLEEAAAFLPDDPLLRESTGRMFVVAIDPQGYRARRSDPEVEEAIRLALDQEKVAMSLWDAVRAGRLKPTLIHGDPKLENFLFDSNTGKVKALVDLDTIMVFTWLADYGDMIRSLVNVAGEKEPDLSRIGIDRDVFAAVTRGFVEAFEEIGEEERSLMAASCLAMVMELAIRFLADWLRGDTYFKLGPKDPPELNRTRALVQFRLYRHMLEFREEAERLVRGS
ncbi:MAG TPA: phosphotransferase, partial [Fimbriimonas sp.]